MRRSWPVFKALAGLILPASLAVFALLAVKKEDWTLLVLTLIAYTLLEILDKLRELTPSATPRVTPGGEV